MELNIISMKYLAFVIFCLSSCNASNKAIKTPCTKVSAENIADNLIKKHYRLSNYNKNIVESNDAFTINYIPKDSLSFGGGAILKISKGNCSVIKKTFFQ